MRYVGVAATRVLGVKTDATSQLYCVIGVRNPFLAVQLDKTVSWDEMRHFPIKGDEDHFVITADVYIKSTSPAASDKFIGHAELPMSTVTEEFKIEPVMLNCVDDACVTVELKVGWFNELQLATENLTPRSMAKFYSGLQTGGQQAVQMLPPAGFSQRGFNAGATQVGAGTLVDASLSSKGQSTVDGSQAASWTNTVGAGASTAHPSMLNSLPVKQTSSRRIGASTMELRSPRNNFSQAIGNKE